MGYLCSQSSSAVGSDDPLQAGEKPVRRYDFRRPGKFKKDMLRTMVMVHENFARLFQGQISAALRTQVKVSVHSINQYSYAEFTQRLPNPTVLVAFRLSRLPGTCLMELSQNIAFAMVDRVLGGPGSEVQPQRGPSEIELSVIQRLVVDMFSPLQDAWRSIADVRISCEGVETNPMFLQTAAPSEVLAVITLGVEMGSVVGRMVLAFPFSTVEPVLSRLSPHVWLADHRSPEEGETEQLRRSVEEAPLEVRVKLGGVTIRLGDLLALKVGHVIPLKTRVDDEVDVYVGNRLTFHGRPGTVGSRMAVEIQRFADNVEPLGVDTVDSGN